MRLITRYMITAFTLFFLFITLEVIYYSREAFYFANGYYYYKSCHISRNNSDLVHDEKQTHPELVSNPKKRFIGIHIARSWKEYQNDSNSTTGNPLIDDYGKNDLRKIGEYGRGVTFVGEEKIKEQKLIEQYQVNVYASDLIPLNRIVPDSRFINCKEIKYPEELPTASVIIPFYDEWPSLLLRTVYSVVNRTPRHLLEQIILVDDGSTLATPTQGPVKHHPALTNSVRCIIIGKYGSGKTQLMTWIKSDRLYLVAPSVDDQRCHEILKDLMKTQSLYVDDGDTNEVNAIDFTTDVDEVPSIDDLDGRVNDLVAYDDVMMHKQSNSAGIFVRGRHKNS